MPCPVSDAQLAHVQPDPIGRAPKLVLPVEQKDPALSATHLCSGELTQCSTRSSKLTEIGLWAAQILCWFSRWNIFFTEKIGLGSDPVFVLLSVIGPKPL